jgi:superfamily II DNA or RNA helicase
MYQLRHYQESLIQAIFARWQAGDRRVMAQLATGGGKTVLFAHIARTFLEQGEGVLVVAHRKELILQAKEKLEAISGLECGIIKAGYKPEPHKDIQVASIQSLGRRKKYPEVGLLIVDECHHASAKSYSDLINRYTKAYVLGVTATPYRSDGQGFKWLFDSLVTGVSTRELIALGHLAKFRLFASRPISTKGISKSGGDFNQSQLEDRAMAVVGDVLPTWEKYAKGKQTIIFAVSVTHSKEIVKLFCDAGYKAEHIDGTTPDSDREAIIERFASKETTILSNVGVFTEGFDVPGIECVQCVRPTMSLSLWLQMVGRGLRPTEDKEYCTIVDHSDNWKAHGLPDEEREWSLDPISLSPGRFKQECPECFHVFSPLSHEQAKPIDTIVDLDGKVLTIHESVCPNCLHKFEWSQGEGVAEGGGRVAKQDVGEVVEVQIECTKEGLSLIRELVAKQESTGKKRGWIYFQLMKHHRAPQMSLGDWRHLAKLLGYKEGWAYKAMDEARSVQLELPIAQNQ